MVAPPFALPQASAALTLQWLADTIARGDPAALRVLRPFDPREALTAKQAAAWADVTGSTIHTWSRAYGLGRMKGGRLAVSAVALAAFLDGDVAALVAYLAGTREGIVRPYLVRVGLA